MSRIGKQPIKVPNGVKVSIDEKSVMLEGPKGKLKLTLPYGIKAEHAENKILIKRLSDTKDHRMKHGLVRALTNNMLIGVVDGFSKDLEIQGVGFKAQISGKKLVLNLGFSHPVEFDIPDGINIQVPKPTQIMIQGIDKQLVGEVAAKIRAFYKPEPYKGKGIRYVGEHVRKKAGKTVA
ncbi:50S ribosomal protein L6 [bacterium]|nr:MAG: 50S ribosomal protein L6 [bacterium]